MRHPLVPPARTASDSPERPTLDSPELRRARRALQIAHVCMAEGELSLATEALDEAIASAPDHPLPSALRGNLLCMSGALPEALSCLRSVTRRWPDAPCGYVFFAEACFFAGRHRQADRALRQAQKLDEQGVWQEHIDALERLWRAQRAA